MRCFAIDAAVLLGVTHASAQSTLPSVEASAPKIDRSGNGAVLCINTLMGGTYAYAVRCHHEKSAELRQIEMNLKRLEEFEVRNGWSPQKAKAFTRHSIDGFEKGVEQRPKRTSKICEAIPPENKKFYSSLVEAFGRPAYKAELSDVLSVPREPVMNPCL